MVKTYLYAFSRFYNSSFQKAPGLTLALTNGALSGVADVVVRLPPYLSIARQQIQADLGWTLGGIGQAQSTQILVRCCFVRCLRRARVLMSVVAFGSTATGRQLERISTLRSRSHAAVRRLWSRNGSHQCVSGHLLSKEA